MKLNSLFCPLALNSPSQQAAKCDPLLLKAKKNGILFDSGHTRCYSSDLLHCLNKGKQMVAVVRTANTAFLLSLSQVKADKPKMRRESR